MPNFSTVTLVGHLGRDPETKYTPGGDAVTEFSIATSRKRGDTETTTWWRCTMWGKRGEAIAKHLAKGDPILVSGEPFMRPWTDSNGKERQSLEIDARDFAFIGSRGERSDRPAKTERSTSAPTPPPGGAAFDDDIPFRSYMTGQEHLV